MSQLTQDIWKISGNHTHNGSVPTFLDSITPGGLTTESFDGLQGFLLNVKTPEEFTAEMQGTSAADRAAGRIPATCTINQLRT